MPLDRAKFSHDKLGLPVGENLVCVCPYEGYLKEEYSLSIGDFGISILAGSEAAAKLAFQTLRQLSIQVDKLGYPYLEIHDKPDLDVRGFMLDISRCKVPTMQTLAYLIDMLALFKYNRLELYTEHTYAFPGHEIVWGNSSPITSQEYKALDEMCKTAGIELVANFNSLGHLERWLRFPEYQHLAESKAPFVDPMGNVRKFPTTLYPDDKALEFVDSIYEQLLPNFSSNKINVGCDEPWELGLGRSKERSEREGGKYKIYLEHLNGLAKICRKYNKKMYFWADVIMQSPEYAKSIPEGVTPIIWGYDYNHPFEAQCKYMQSLGLKFLVAPGTSTWNSFGFRMVNMLENISNACKNAKLHGGDGMLLTNWGDNGNHQPFCGMYPAIVCAANASWGAKLRMSDSELIDALSVFVFRDASRNFATSLIKLGKLDPENILQCYYNKIFFADNAHIKEILKHPHFIELETMETLLKESAEYLSKSTPQSPDGQICIAEIRLALDMISFAIHRAKNDPALSSNISRRNLKVLVGHYEQIWLARARIGGLQESSRRIRNLSNLLFITQYAH